jgi:glycerol uptake facilitator-like aquaporin
VNANTLGQRLLAEFIGTALLLAAIVGSGTMGAALSGGNDGIALLSNSGATAGVLYVLVVVFAPVSGAHFNPAVTLAFRLRGEMDSREAAAYVLLQVLGAVAGTLLAHAMFDLALVQPGVHVRSGIPQWTSEAVATCGLVMAILLGLRHRPDAIPALVASYIFAAYWFTASTSFANPAVTVARALTRTFSGIRPADVPGFVLAQFAGVCIALVLVAALSPRTRPWTT